MGLFSYDYNEKGTLRIHSKNPVSEIDILRAALCLVDPSNFSVVGNWLTKKEKYCLHFAQSRHPSYTYDDKLSNDDVIQFIDILNRFYDHMVKEERTCELLLMTLTVEPHRLFGRGYGHPLHPTTTYPFRMILMNRHDPALTRHHSFISSTCSFENIVEIAPHPVPAHPTPMRKLPLIVAGAVLILGVAALLIARVYTGEIGAFFALGAFRGAGGRLISGFPHVGVGLMALAAYAGLRYNEVQAQPVLPTWSLKQKI